MIGGNHLSLAVCKSDNQDAALEVHAFERGPERISSHRIECDIDTACQRLDLRNHPSWPHPNAAVLFYDFELSEEGQRILAKRDFVPTNRKVESPLNKIPLLVVDPKVMLDQQAKWSKLYEELFLKQR